MVISFEQMVWQKFPFVPLLFFWQVDLRCTLWSTRCLEVLMCCLCVKMMSASSLLVELTSAPPTWISKWSNMSTRGSLMVRDIWVCYFLLNILAVIKAPFLLQFLIVWWPLEHVKVFRDSMYLSHELHSPSPPLPSPCPPKFVTHFVCARITRKCLDWFCSLKNSWIAFWTD